MLLMVQSNVDVMILTDTQHTERTARTYRTHFQRRMGGSAKLHASSTKEMHFGKRRPLTATHSRKGSGGSMILIGPKWGPSMINARSDDTGCGVLTEVQLRTTQGTVNILGTYWPSKPEAARIQEGAGNLWSRVSDFLASRHNTGTPVTYVQDLALAWTQTALKNGAHAVILTGDLNSTVSSSEGGGQRQLQRWTTEHSFLNGPSGVSQQLGIPFYTHGIETQNPTWIDHILHFGSADNIDIMGAYNSQGAEWEGVSDHKPIWAHYNMAGPVTDHPVKPQKVAKRPEIPLHDPRQVDAFQRQLHDIFQRIPYNGEDDDAAELYLEQATQFIVDTTRNINKKHHREYKNRFKDGFSPEFLVSKWHLEVIIHVRRKLLGHKGHTRCKTQAELVQYVEAEFELLVTRATGLLEDAGRVLQILNMTNKGPDWWTANIFTREDCDTEIKAIKRLLHGRKRTDLRQQWNSRTKWLEQQREKGKTGRIIKAVLHTLAGRKHQAGSNLETVRDSSTTHVTPETVHTASTAHFEKWYDMPEHLLNTLHAIPDWKPHFNDFNVFKSAYPHCQVPEHLMRRIYDAMQDVDNSEKVRKELSEQLAEPPSLEEFENKIRKLKSYSSPGPSGLTYNMLKKCPSTTTKELYKCLKQMWANKRIATSWKWRWLVPIPKKPTDSPALEDLRPLMLCEALRKVWTSLVLSKINKTFKKYHVLDVAQHGYQRGKSTSTASMIHINALEDAEELEHDLHRTSYDLKKAFDSVSKPLILLSWQRLGVPLEIAEWLTNMDIGGTTIVKTPYAQLVWDLLPYYAVDTKGDYPPGHEACEKPILESFDAIRGTGQGDVSSPPCWTAVMDIILTALRKLDHNNPAVAYYRADGPNLYASEESAYADDKESNCSSAEHLQEKADLVSAFCF